MSVEPSFRSLLDSAVRDFRSSWSSLVLTDIAFKLVAFVVLTPLVSVLFRALLAFSGSAVVSDLDILFFFLGPVGWVCGIIVGALWLGIIALEQASLMGVIYSRSADQTARWGPVAALRFAAKNAWPVLRVTLRIVARTLLAIAPFVAVGAAVYFTLLTEYDINYYLQERPPAFTVAVCTGIILAGALTALLLRLLTSWFFALPLVLFEKTSPREALKTSAARAHGHRCMLLCWIVVWALAMVLLSALAAAVVGLTGRLLTPDSTDSLRTLAFTIGLTLFLWAIANLAVNLLTTTTLAAMLVNLYREFGRHGASGHASFVAEATGGMNNQVGRKRLIATGVVGSLIAVAIAAAALQSVRLDDNVKVMAHRGSSHSAPENTMAAFRQAIEDGADWIELDVQETADGEVVVVHDRDFMKLAGKNLTVWSAAMDDLKDIDVGSWFAPEFKDERVPTLGEVLEQCKGRIRVNIELKYYGYDEKLEQRVADIVDAHNMASDVIAMSLRMDAVQKMKAIRPDWKVGLLMSVYAGNLRKIEADFLAVNAGFAGRRLIRAAHENGKEVYVWTVNDAATMSAMISHGVDGLLTDKPALARSVLQQRAQMSAPERLLLELAVLLGSAPEIGEQ